MGRGHFEDIGPRFRQESNIKKSILEKMGFGKLEWN